MGSFVSYSIVDMCLVEHLVIRPCEDLQAYKRATQTPDTTWVEINTQKKWE